jgi:hypothetical protein
MKKCINGRLNSTHVFILDVLENREKKEEKSYILSDCCCGPNDHVWLIGCRQPRFGFG